MKKLILNSIITGFVFFGLNACENFVNGVDELDPNLPRDASLGQVMNSAEVAYIGFMEGDVARIAGIFTGQFTGVDRQYVSLNEYITTSGDYDSQWDNIYASVIKGLRIAQAKATQVNNKKALALAQILEAHTIGMTASLWGDVPYSQIVQLQNFPNPAFDPQGDIYADVIELLNTAISNINSAAATSAFEGDIFGGNDAVWIARANTLKAKFHLHIGEYANALIAAGAGIANPENDLVATHGLSYGSNMNVYASFLDWDRPGYLSASGAFAPLMLDPGSTAAFNRNNSKTDETARFNYIYLDNFGIYNTGYELNFMDDDYYGYPDGYFGADAPWYIVTYKENQLILAEAELRENGFVNALNELNELRDVLDKGAYINPAYTDADNLDFALNYDLYDAADFAPSGIENADGITPEDALYREIIEEKYVSLLGQLEVFNDMRRNGFGSFSAMQNWQVLGIPVKGTNTRIPQRFLIAQSEINSNTSTPPTIPALFDRPTFPK
jgi:starch-binding outer membrane protein, SusD/RagB family